MEGFNNKSVLFVIPDQFGYSAGYYYYCKYLVKANITVGIICIDQNKKKIKEPDGVKVYYLRNSSKIQNRFSVINKILDLKGEYDIFILKYFIGVSFLKVFLISKKTFLDIRSASIRSSKFKRKFEDIFIYLSSIIFNNIYILSKDLARKLHISQKKIIELPLGADELSTKNKNYLDSINLLYIGTFNKRNINQCVKGFAKFYEEYSNKITLSIDIIGTGNAEETEKIKDIIVNYSLTDVVTIHGYLNHENAKYFFDKCNYGIAFVPITDYFLLQPPTKVYEYILSGLVCIATETQANKALITCDNGVLHNDTIQGFYNALVTIYNHRSIYSTQKVKLTLKPFLWENIIKDVLIKSIISIK